MKQELSSRNKIIDFIGYNLKSSLIGFSELFSFFGGDMNIDKNTKAFVRGTALISFSVIITKVMGVFYKVPLSYVLGDEGMGYFNSAYAIYSFLYVLCVSGVPKAITISLAENGRYKSDDSGHVLLKRAISLFTKIGIAVTAINIACAPALVKLIGSKNSLYTILAIAPSIIFVSVSGVLRGCMNYYDKLSKIAVSQLIEAALKLVLGLAFAFIGVRMRLSLPLISALCVLGITLGNMASCLYLLMLFKKMFRDKKAGQSGFDYKKVLRKSIYKIALPISLGAAVLNLGGMIDLGIIMNKLTETGMSEQEANAIYGNYTTLAVPMVNLVISVISPIMLAFLPKLASAYVKRDVNESSDIFRRMILVNSAISIPSSFAFAFYSFEILDILFSVSSAAIGAELLAILALGLILLSLLTVINTALEAQGKIKHSVVSLVVGSAVKLLGNIILIEKLGMIGAPVSTVISYAVSFLLSIVGLSDRANKIVVLNSLFDVLVGAVCFALPYIFIYSRACANNGLFVSALSMAISCILYFSVFCIRMLRLRRAKNVESAQKNM